jgi:transposase
MKRGNLDLRQALIRQLVAGQLALQVVAQRLGCHPRTVRRYRARFFQQGPEGLRDCRGGNHRKLTRAQELAIVQAKRQGPHRSARWIRDHLHLRVHRRTIWAVLVKHQLNRLSLPTLKPIERFEAPHPNDLWQIDLQGQVKFPHLGWLHLVLILDDHSRFRLAGGWFRAAHKVNVFACLYRAFMRYGLPQAILSDRGSQFHPTGRRGQTDFEEYMARLGITLIPAKRARTKGKIERRFGFVQRDFVREHLQERSLERLNVAWQEWMHWANHGFHSEALGGHTASQHYRPSSRRRSKAELQVLLTHEEPRRVRLEGTISYYGRDYRVPPGYLKCRVWTKLRGDTLRIESQGQIIAKHKLAS